MPLAPGQSPYDIQRQRIKDNASATGQQENDALKRRFARMGGLNSGSYVKAQEQLSGQQEKNTNQALEGVDIQESQANEAKAEAEKNRQFQTSERLGSQQFTAGESAMSRALQERQFNQTFEENKRQFGESMAQQIEARKQQGEQFSASLGEQKAAREQQASQFGQSLGEQKAARSQQSEQFGQSLGEQQAARAQQGEQFTSQLAQQKEQFGQQMVLANQQFVLDEKVSNFNMDMADKIFNKKDFMEKAIDPFGGIDKSSEKAPGALGYFSHVGTLGGTFA